MGALEQQINLPLGPIKFEMSAEIGKLVDALAKARKAFKPVIKDATNPFFKSKYADLASVIEATKDGLSDNGLAVLQFPIYSGNGTVQVITVLAHSSGEWMKSSLDIPLSKSDAQGIGSGTTYARRYAYSAIVNVASEEDDDANGAVSQPFKRKEESHEDFDQRTEDQQNITVAQLQEIDKALKRTGKQEDEIIAALGFIGERRLEHIKKGQFQKFLKWANGTPKTKTLDSVDLHAKLQGGKPAVESDRTVANKRLWALAAEHSIPEEDVKRCAYERYKVQSMTELTAAQLEDMGKWVKEVATAVAES